MNNAMLWLEGSIPVPRRRVQCVSNYYYVNLPKELNTVWEVYSANGVQLDVVVRLPDVVARIVGFDRVLMGKKKIVKKGDRYALYLSKMYEDIWRLVHENKATIDLLLIPRVEAGRTT